MGFCLSARDWLIHTHLTYVFKNGFANLIALFLSFDTLILATVLCSILFPIPIDQLHVWNFYVIWINTPIEIRSVAWLVETISISHFLSLSFSLGRFLALSRGTIFECLDLIVLGSCFPIVILCHLFKN